MQRIDMKAMQDALPSRDGSIDNNDKINEVITFTRTGILG